MTKNQIKAHELYEKMENKDGISEEFLYNAICYFEIPPEKVVEMLLQLPDENKEQLTKAFADVRSSVKEMLKKTLESHDFSAPFHNEEIEDIIFYQVAHGQPVS